MTKREFAPFTASSNAKHSLVTWFGQADKFRVSSKSGFNETLVKDKAAVLVGWHLVNRSIGWRHVNFYDQASERFAKHTNIDWVLTIPPDQSSTAEFALQIPYFVGLAFTITADDGKPVNEGDVEGVLLYA